MKKATVIVICFILILSFGIGCSQNDSQLDNENLSNDNTNGITPSDDGNSDNDKEDDKKFPNEMQNDSSPSDLTPEMKTETGTYMGQIDNNSIEVRVSGILDDGLAFKSYIIDENFKDRFTALNLTENAQVKYQYKVNEHNQNILYEMEILNTHSEETSVTEYNPFSIVFNGKTISLMDWDDKVDISSILGEPVSETTEAIGQGGDTFAGSFIKEMKYDGLVLKLMSPKDNGITFYVMSMVISSDSYTNLDGITIGSNLTKLEQTYSSLKKVEDNSTDLNNCSYILQGNDFNNIKFTVADGNVIEIEIFYELQ